MHTSTLFNDTEQQIVAIQNERQEIVEYKTRGATVRCKARWIEEGEKVTKYYLNLEKQKKNQQVIFALKNQQTGKKLTHQGQILKEQMKLYKLYTLLEKKRLLIPKTI